MSRPPLSPTAEAAEETGAAALATAALAERLVEDPAFEDAPAAGRPLEKEPGSDAAGDGEDAVAVLSAASPPPADPALRLHERQRNRAGERPAEAQAQPAYTVQLLAVSRREQATQAWSRLYRDHPDLLGRLQPIIVEPEQRVTSLFRLRAGPMASASEAQSVCASLARRGIECIVVHRSG
jgi:cell division septation protein DedD